MFFHYHYRRHHYIQWWESAGDKSPPLSLLSKPHHGGFLTGGNMPVSHDHDDVGGGGKLAIKGRPAPRARSEAFILLHRSLHSLRPSAFLSFSRPVPLLFYPLGKYCFVDFSPNFVSQFFCNTIFSLFWGKYLMERPL